MIARPIFENFRNDFLGYFQEEVLIAEFDRHHNMIVMANPYMDFEQLAMDICDNILETVFFTQHLEVYLYRFGENQYLRISIN